MEIVTPTVEPFAYPTEPHSRRHGPSGYTNYQSYRPWLEDEFSFRCVYCLKRMVWAPTDVWSVDHIVPQVDAGDLACVYENLVLACQYCNRMKSDHHVPDPGQVAYGRCLRVGANGAITPLNKQGKRLIRELRLNHPGYTRWRFVRIQELHSLARNDPKIYELAMGFPQELPDLRKLQVESNSRPQGINESWHEKRRRGELPRVY